VELAQTNSALLGLFGGGVLLFVALAVLAVIGAGLCLALLAALFLFVGAS
jgi:hypothetical protein